MRTVKLEKKDLDAFLSKINTLGELWGPRKKGDVVIYDKIDELEDLIKKPVTTFLPVKKLFLPPRFRMLHFDGKSYNEEENMSGQRIVYGVPSCEVHSLLIFDKLFGLEYKDPYYLKRREKTAIIALSCSPRTGCLCQSAHTHVIEEGFDLAITDLEDFYLVWVGSSKGDDLIRVAPKLFDVNVTQDDIQDFIEWRECRNGQFKTAIDFEIMPDLIDLNNESPIWEQLADKCLSCGACTMVCPTCNCFDVVDEIELEDGSVDRKRFWDSCMFREYSMVAGGHNFREAKADRLKLWYTHKLKSFTGAYKKFSCVGCGRCIVTCPVDINVRSVSQALLTAEVDRDSLLTGDWK